MPTRMSTRSPDGEVEFADETAESSETATTTQTAEASTESPDTTADSVVVEYLRANGPTPADDLPHAVQTADRYLGVRRLSFTGSPGAGELKTGTQTSVLYLDSHEPTAVVRTYLDANENVIQSTTKQGLSLRFGRVDSDLQEAFGTVASDYDIPVPDRDPSHRGAVQNESEKADEDVPAGMKKCPNCGRNVAPTRYPKHLAGVACKSGETDDETDE